MSEKSNERLPLTANHDKFACLRLSCSVRVSLAAWRPHEQLCSKLSRQTGYNLNALSRADAADAHEAVQSRMWWSARDDESAITAQHAVDVHWLLIMSMPSCRSCVTFHPGSMLVS